MMADPRRRIESDKCDSIYVKKSQPKYPIDTSI